MRLFLTSNAFPATSQTLQKRFFEFVGKKPDELKVAFIPTASEVEEDRSFMLVDRKELEEMGISKENITDLELDHEITLEELRKFNVIFVDGGNTFYLLQKMKESQFDKAIKEYLEQDLGVYVGVSAGTIIVGSNIEATEPWDDKTKATLTDTIGLGFIKEVYSPHYKEEEKETLDSIRKRVNYPIKELRDGQAVVVVNGAQEFIEN